MKTDGIVTPRVPNPRQPVTRSSVTTLSGNRDKCLIEQHCLPASYARITPMGGFEWVYRYHRKKLFLLKCGRSRGFILANRRRMRRGTRGGASMVSRREMGIFVIFCRCGPRYDELTSAQTTSAVPLAGRRFRRKADGCLSCESNEDRRIALLAAIMKIPAHGLLSRAIQSGKIPQLMPCLG